MLLRREILVGVRRGTISLAFRRWRKPTVRSGGTLMTAAGQLQIGGVSVVSPATITEADAARAGYASKEALLADLAHPTDGKVYRIELGPLRADPRTALREASARKDELAELRRRLDRLDSASAAGPWTQRTLQVIKDQPGVRAGDLGESLGQTREQFKRNVRKLKNLGLTESLEVGYRLAPRGVSLLMALESAKARREEG